MDEKRDFPDFPLLFQQIWAYLDDPNMHTPEGLESAKRACRILCETIYFGLTKAGGGGTCGKYPVMR